MATTFNYLASQLVSAREAFPSKSYKSLGLLPQLRRQAVGPDSQGEGAEGLALGNPERILRAVKRWESVGVDRINFLLNCMEEIPQEQVLKSLRLFAREVMPHFQHPATPATTLWAAQRSRTWPVPPLVDAQGFNETAD